MGWARRARQRARRRRKELIRRLFLRRLPGPFWTALERSPADRRNLARLLTAYEDVLDEAFFTVAELLRRRDTAITHVEAQRLFVLSKPHALTTIQNALAATDTMTLMSLRVEREFAKRALFLKESVRNLLTSIYLVVAPTRLDQPLPARWQRFGARRERLRQRHPDTPADQPLDFVGTAFKELPCVDRHFDNTSFTDCSFDDADLTNASFTNTQFLRCSFKRVIMRNARLTGAEFEGCDFEDVDLGGAILDDMRLWYPNRCVGLRADAWTRLRVPLPEEEEFAYELAARNYLIYERAFAEAGWRRMPSLLAYRRQVARDATLPIGPGRLRARLASILVGYGERPLRFSIFLGGVIGVFAWAYWRFGMLIRGDGDVTPLGFGDALYFSVVTFTTLGFGDILPAGQVGKIVAMVEVTVGMIGIAVLTALVLRRLLRS